MTLPRWQCPACGGAIGDIPRSCANCGGGWPRWAVAGYWIAGELAPPRGFDGERRAHLAAIEQSHFWFPSRKRLLSRLLTRALPHAPTTGVELGCGTGRMLPLLSASITHLVGVDGWPESLAAAAREGSGATLLQADLEARLPFDSGAFQVAFAFDVLEHVDPRRFLREVHRIVQRGGRLILSVPAFPMLYGAADARAGHRCRYRLRGLEAELAEHGFRLLGHAYYQCLLFPALLASRRLLQRRVDGLERRPPRWLGGTLGAINRLEVAAGRFIRWPFGSSLFAWAEAT